MPQVKQRTWVKLEEPVRARPAVFEEPSLAKAMVLAGHLFASLTTRGGKVSLYAFDPEKVAGEPLKVLGS